MLLADVRPGASVWQVLSDKQAREVEVLRRHLRLVLSDIRAWPEDDARYRSLLVDLRELVRRLDEKLPPVAEPLA
jgi:hypothetical protein